MDLRVLNGKTDVEIQRIVYDSRNVQPEDVFVCIEGTVYDGHSFAVEAVEKGAAVIVCSRPLSFEDNGITVILVENCRRALAELSARFYDYPSNKLKVIGITGTKGKTSTSYMLKSVFDYAGIKTGLMGTVEIDTGRGAAPSSQTTPESLDVQRNLAEMVKCGCEAAIIEVSSQALKQYRVHGITFDLGILTNVAADHIGPAEHQNFEEYLACKCSLFTQCRKGIINLDDIYARRFMKHCSEVMTYGISHSADLCAEKIDYVRIPDKFAMEFQTKGRYNINLVVGAAGLFSVYNALAVVLAAKEFFVSDACLVTGLRTFSARGRQEVVSDEYNRTIMVDYAHNGMALKALLKELRCYKPEKITCVFGCGGGRDRNRRFEMGKMAAKYADFAIITSDNPRNESPRSIISDIIIKMETYGGNYRVIEDRREAIAYAVERCKPGEIVVIAGKGHETYQIIGKEKIHFDDREEVRKSMEKVNDGKNYNRRN